MNETTRSDGWAAAIWECFTITLRWLALLVVAIIIGLAIVDMLRAGEWQKLGDPLPAGCQENSPIYHGWNVVRDKDGRIISPVADVETQIDADGSEHRDLPPDGAKLFSLRVKEEVIQGRKRASEYFCLALEKGRK